MAIDAAGDRNRVSGRVFCIGEFITGAGVKPAELKPVFPCHFAKRPHVFAIENQFRQRLPGFVAPPQRVQQDVRSDGIPAFQFDDPVAVLARNHEVKVANIEFRNRLDSWT